MGILDLGFSTVKYMYACYTHTHKVHMIFLSVEGECYETQR